MVHKSLIDQKAAINVKIYDSYPKIMPSRAYEYVVNLLMCCVVDIKIFKFLSCELLRMERQAQMRSTNMYYMLRHCLNEQRNPR